MNPIDEIASDLCFAISDTEISVVCNCELLPRSRSSELRSLGFFQYKLERTNLPMLRAALPTQVYRLRNVPLRSTVGPSGYGPEDQLSSRSRLDAFLWRVARESPTDRTLRIATQHL